MALTREKIASSVSDLKEAIHSTAMKGQLDKRGIINGTGKIPGYVCAIHGDDDENEELRGTVDVQEYNYVAEEHNGQAAGFHEGVLLSAITDNQNGYRIIPCLFSEVVIAKDPYTLQEYVVMYSHASVIEMKVHDQIDLNVTEYKDFKETDDGLENDYDELEETGNKTAEKHTASEITKEVIDKSGENKDEMLADKRTLTVGNTTITFDKNTIKIKTSNKIDIEANYITANGKFVKITGGQLTTQGITTPDLNGPYNAVKVCPFSGAPHCGSIVLNT